MQLGRWLESRSYAYFTFSVLRGVRLNMLALLIALLTGVSNTAFGSNNSLALASSAEFVGSVECSQCHTNEAKDWKQSHHAKAMMTPSSETVLGDFSGAEFRHRGVETRFFKEGPKYKIETQNQYGKQEIFSISYTFGVYPLQQYLIDIGQGKLQAFDVAWDSRPSNQGGQKWFKLLPNEDTSPKSLFHWTRHTQNWNARCSDCHSTNVERGFDAKSNSYATTFEEESVGCESCHGAGSQHVDLVKQGAYKRNSRSGFDTYLAPAVAFSFEQGKDIAVPTGKPSKNQVNACGGCHSRRQAIASFDPASDYHDQFILRTIDQNLYHADGQIQDEVFVLGSFLQSKMAQAGVTCTNCHNPHSGVLKVEGNGLCTQCHKPQAYDNEMHHKHKPDTEAAQCVTCHMPTTTYMEVDDRRDHSFKVPHPKTSELSGSPSVCKSCHQEQSNEWASMTIDTWAAQPEFDLFATANLYAQDSDPLGLRKVVEYIDNQENPAIKRATLLALTGNIPSRVSLETISKNLSSTEPMVRKAAVDACDFLPIENRWILLKEKMEDPSASVRFSVARQLVGYERELKGAELSALNKLVAEYAQQLRLSSDFPSGQLEIAAFELRRGNIEQAFEAYEQALVIEPDFSPALLNMADLYRGLGNESRSLETLERALTVAPDSGAVQHAYGLALIRKQDKQKALKHLKLATEQIDAGVRYAYVYAIALDSVGNTSEAIDVLEETNQKWPNQYDVLLSLVTYLDQEGREPESLKYLSNLSAIAPNDPNVRSRIQQLQAE
jgi:predicted CXXCH cytochrome family protein